jgi:hypothetical protein
MIIKLSPQGGHEATTQLAVVDDNSLIIDGTHYQLPVALITLDPTGPILSGTRQADGWHLTVLYHYADADRDEWETPHPETGKYRGEDHEAWEATGKDTTGLPIVVLTGKTQADLDAQAKAASIAVLKAELASLDLIIPRSTEDLYAAMGATPYPAVQAAIDKKTALRTQIKQAGG